MNNKRVDWYQRQRVDDLDMITERDYITERCADMFDRIVGSGVISGLAVSDDSSIVDQSVANQFYDTWIDTVGNQIIQIFKATADNLQQIIIRGRNVGAAGNVILSLHSLVTPTDMNSNITPTPLGQVAIPNGSFGGAFAEVTVDVSVLANVSTAGSLTVGHYYAIILYRDNGIGSIDISYSDGNEYTDGHIREYDVATGIYTNRTTWDLYFKVNGDAVQIALGLAYKNGDPIEIATAQRKINLADTSGVTNYICIKYLEVETDPEIHPRSGLLVYSRIQDYWEIVVYNNLASITSNDELIATTAHTGVFPLTIVDRRVYIPEGNTLWDGYVNKNVVLTAQSCDPTLVLKDPVYYNIVTLRWEKASFTNAPRGVYTANGEVTLFGQKTGLVGLTVGIQYMSITGDLTTTPTAIMMGLAISTTTLIVDVKYLSGSQEFLTSGNFVVPPFVNRVSITMGGGGGAGGGCYYATPGHGGGGGGAGNFIVQRNISVIPGEIIVVTIGSGGVGGTGGTGPTPQGTNGGDGGNSLFGGYLTAYGGNGGQAGQPLAGGNGGTGALGTPANTDSQFYSVLIQDGAGGGDGGVGNAPGIDGTDGGDCGDYIGGIGGTQNFNGGGGGGGASNVSNGGNGGSGTGGTHIGSNGIINTGTGGGGGGGVSGGNGGNGGSGYCIVEWF